MFTALELLSNLMAMQPLMNTNCAHVLWTPKSKKACSNRTQSEWKVGLIVDDHKASHCPVEHDWRTKEAPRISHGKKYFRTNHMNELGSRSMMF